jgi:hypothetical protein
MRIPHLNERTGESGRAERHRALGALALAAAVAAPALLSATDVTLARISVNHNETPGRDGRP